MATGGETDDAEANGTGAADSERERSARTVASTIPAAIATAPTTRAGPVGTVTRSAARIAGGAAIAAMRRRLLMGRDIDGDERTSEIDVWRSA